MKKIYLKSLTILLLLILASNSLNAQEFKKVFLGDKFIEYKGLQIKFDSTRTGGLSHTLYADYKKATDGMYNNDVAFPSKKYSFNTEKDSLLDKIFIVEKITNQDGEEIDNLDNVGILHKPIFHLKNIKTNNYLYFKYDPKYEHSFIFLTAGYSFNEDLLAKDISKEIDDFTGEIKYNSPLSENYSMNDMIIYKQINKGAPVYYLSLHTTGSTVNVKERGVIILFEDGTKLSKPNIEINVKAGDRGFNYSAFFSLTSNDLIALKSKKIKKYRLYIYDNTIDQNFADKFRIYVKKIMELK